MTLSVPCPYCARPVFHHLFLRDANKFEGRRDTKWNSQVGKVGTVLLTKEFALKKFYTFLMSSNEKYMMDNWTCQQT
jgi:hypothetical protein